MKLKNMSLNDILGLVTAVFVALMMTCYLLYAGTFGFQNIANAKYSAFLTICGGYVALMALLAVEAVLIGGVKMPSARKMIAGSTWPQRLAVIYMLLTWLSALLSPHFPATITGVSRSEGALTITIYCAVFLLLSVCGEVRRWMLPVLAAAATVFDIICILQLYGLNPLSLYPEGYDYFGKNVDYSGAYLGTIGNVDLVAAFLCLAIPLFWVSLIRMSGRKKWLLLIPLGLSVFVLLKMWVLAGLVGVFAGGAVALCAVLPASAATRRKLWFLLAGCAVGALALLYFATPGSGMFHEIHLLLHGKAEDTFGSGRIYIWRNVLQRVPDQFWLGSGPDTMALAGIEPFTKYNENLNMMLVAEIDMAHNEYLNVLFHQGVFAFAAYLGMLVLLAVKWLRRASTVPAVAVLGSAAACYCVQAFFGFSLCMTAPFFWMVLGLLEASCKDSLNGGKKLC